MLFHSDAVGVTPILIHLVGSRMREHGSRTEQYKDYHLHCEDAQQRNYTYSFLFYLLKSNSNHSIVSRLISDLIFRP